jgi:transposase InsO family protein
MSQLCNAAEMSRQAYYKWKNRLTLWDQIETVLLKLVRAIRKLMPELGGRKILHELGKLFPFGRDRFFAWLKRHGLLATRKRRFPATTYSKHILKKYRNLIRDFKATAAGQVVVSDITYIALEEGKFAYAALVTDAFSRKIVGYHLSLDLSVSGPLKALRMALRSVPDPTGLIHHSDRGVQYCSKQYIDELKRHGVSISMTERQHCAENAMAERVNGILKHEFGLKNRFRTIAAARQALHQSVWIYNNLRPHLSLNYAKPAQVHDA